MIAYKYVAKCDFFLGDFFVNEGDTVHLDKDISKSLHGALIDKVCINGALALTGGRYFDTKELRERLERVHCRGDFNHGESGDMKSPPIGEGGKGVRVIDNKSILIYSSLPRVSPFDRKRVELRLSPEIKKGELISVEGELFRVYDSIVMIQAVLHED